MVGLPTSLTKKLSHASREEAQRWWSTLSDEERRALREPRAEARVLVRFVETSQEPASNEFYEYLVNHEVTLEDGTRRHICRAHPRARAVLASGRIPAGFTCPLAHDACPMRALLAHAPGHDAVLEVRDDG